MHQEIPKVEGPTCWPIRGFGFDSFRTLRDVRFTCSGPVTVVCGPNNSGKSSLLAALDIYPRLFEVMTNLPRGVERAVQLKGLSSPVEGPMVAIDLSSEPVAEHLAQGNSRDAAAIQRSMVHELGEILWVKFKQKNEGYLLAFEESCRPLNELLRRWTNEPNRRRWPDAFSDGSRVHRPPLLGAAWLKIIWDLCLVRPEIRFIADVRRAADKPLDDGALWKLARASSHRTGGARRRLEPWAEVLEFILQDVFGDGVRYEVTPLADSGDVRLSIDGQDDISLEQVGAGVREVVAVAYAALSTEGATVLAIEEPENCLHPSAVRRLISSVAERVGTQLFVATHSAAVVNTEAKTLLHLTRTGATTSVRQVDNLSDKYNAVRSLGYSPADLVLTPCAVWVEGPSDRVYFTQWLRLHGLIEGVDYQMLFYAGALAAHISATAETFPDQELIAIRNLARRCVVIADSDRSGPDDSLKPHVARFEKELDEDGDALLIVTWGREVENYLGVDVANEVRARHRSNRLKAANDDAFRYRRVIDQPLVRSIGKVRFAESALSVLGDEIPEQARSHVSILADFIRASRID